MNVTERFLKYVSFGTASDENSETCPSTSKQLLLGKYLAEELAKIGLADARIDEHGYVYAYLPASSGCENVPTVGFIAHMDTSPDAPGDGVKPKIITYAGGDIALNEKTVISPVEYPAVAKYAGEELIVTDGTTLLGADDKAGVAEIFTAVEYLKNHPEIKHGKIAVGITPDEEIGRGADLFDIKNFGAEYAYTVDGGELGEIEYENFNAASAKFTVNGVNIHPGEAKNKMVNAALIAVELIGMLPPAETPAHTEGYEGFYHVNEMCGNETCATVAMIIRDHDRVKFEARKRFVTELANYLNGKYGEGTVELALRDSYYNMKEKILPHIEIVHKAEEAMKKTGVTPKIVAIRGGTDGARLSYDGLPCPNLSTGGINFHSVREFIPVKSLEKMTEVIIELSRV